LHETYSDRSKPNDAIRTLAAEAAPPTLSEADRIAALVRVARDRVKRIDVDTATEEERREARANKNAADAVKRRLDTADDQLVVFSLSRRPRGSTRESPPSRIDRVNSTRPASRIRSSSGGGSRRFTPQPAGRSSISATSTPRPVVFGGTSSGRKR
jgi:hypothetical protein